MDVNIRIAGEAGQGVQTTGTLLTGALAASGHFVYSTQSYMSRIRGGVNWYDIRVSDGELHSARLDADILVAFTAQSLAATRSHLAKGGELLCSKEACGSGEGLDFAAVSREVAGSTRMANTVAAGAVLGLLGLDAGKLGSYLHSMFDGKDAKIADQNAECAMRGAALVADRAGSIPCPAPNGAPAHVISGSECCGLGAAVAGVKVVSSYPMTPSTGVFQYLAQHAEEFGITVEQAEDEIAAINLVCGAVYAGAPAMTTTSGGGFALMAEGLSNAGICELPAFVLLSQRPGPATGLPTRTGQEDLQFAIHAGHGEFPRLVYAPGTLQECYELIQHSLERAHRFQVPTIFLIDQYIADLVTNCIPLSREQRPVDRHTVEAGDDYRRYVITDDGISPRAVPGGEAFVVTDSDEHDETGHLTEDLGIRVAQQDKRMRKQVAMEADWLPPRFYGHERCANLLICWGSTLGPCIEAVQTLNARDGGGWGVLFFPQLWPVSAKVASEAVSRVRASRIVVVEGNFTGQFESLLRSCGVLGGCEHLRRYDGLQFTGEEIVKGVEQK